MKKFTTNELLGIIIMSASLAGGLITGYLGINQKSDTLEGFSSFLTGPVHMDQIKDNVEGLALGFKKAEKLLGISSLLFWVFLGGLMIFVISRRKQYNAQLNCSQQ